MAVSTTAGPGATARAATLLFSLFLPLLNETCRPSRAPVPAPSPPAPSPPSSCGQAALSAKSACVQLHNARKARSEQLRSYIAVTFCKLQHVGTAGRTGELFQALPSHLQLFAVVAACGTTRARSRGLHRSARTVHERHDDVHARGGALGATPRWTCWSCNYDRTSQSEALMTVCAACCTPKAPSPPHRRSVSFSDVETVDTIEPANGGPDAERRGMRVKIARDDVDWSQVEKRLRQ